MSFVFILPRHYSSRYVININVVGPTLVIPLGVRYKRCDLSRAKCTTGYGYKHCDLRRSKHSMHKLKVKISLPTV